MTFSETSDAIHERAAAWVARADRGALGHNEQAELNAWLAGDPRHKGAFVRAQALWLTLDGLAAREGTIGGASARPLWNRRGTLMAGGSALAASLVAGGLVLTQGGRLSTGVGEVRQAPLGDGSRITLDTASVASIHFGRHLREVQLKRGQAWFDVQKDPARPFVVQADGVQVQAVGTAFSVRCTELGAQILVNEGVVEAWSDQAPERRVRLKAGQSADLTRTPTASAVRSELSDQEVERRLAWRAGDIVLNGETVAQAAQEFNRYNRIQIVVDDPALRTATLIGAFRATDPQAFAQTASTVLGTRLVKSHDALTLFAPTS